MCVSIESVYNLIYIQEFEARVAKLRETPGLFIYYPECPFIFRTNNIDTISWIWSNAQTVNKNKSVNSLNWDFLWEKVLDYKINVNL